MGACASCGGTGWQWPDRTWFVGDGMYKARCGICAGTGEQIVSAFRDNPRWIAEQERRRSRASGLPVKEV